jgi:hypothetical protein
MNELVVVLSLPIYLVQGNLPGMNHIDHLTVNRARS